ncbi:MAG: tetratricopeptide repeat protein [Spirochaetota bacterium]
MMTRIPIIHHMARIRFFLIISLSAAALHAKPIPAVYLIDTFPSWQLAGSASPYFMPLSASMRYNPSVMVFMPKNDVTFVYKPFFLTPEDIPIGLSFTRTLSEDIVIGAVFSMFSTVNILNIGRTAADDTLTGYAAYLITPSVAWRINSNVSVGGEVELHYQSFANESFLEVDFGLSGSFVYGNFYAGLSVQNIISPFANWDMPFMIMNSESLSFFDKRLILSLGLSFRLQDTHFGIAGGVRWIPIDLIEACVAYNDGNISAGSAITFEAFRFDYTFAFDIFNVLSPFKHTVGVTLFYSDLFGGASAADRLGEIQKLMSQADTLYSARRYREAIAQWSRVLSMDKNHAEAALRIARTKNDLAKLTRALIQDGLAAMKKDDYPTALSLFSEVLRNDPDNADAKTYIAQIGKLAVQEREKYRLMAQNSFEKGDFEEALRQVDMALMMDPEHAQSSELKGKIQDSLGRQAEIDKRRDTGREFVANGRQEAAKKNFPKAIGLYEKSLAYFDGKEKKDVEELIAKTKKAAEDEGKLQNAQVYFTIGREAYAQNDRERAVLNLNKALDIYPDYDEARALLDEIDKSRKEKVNSALARGKAAFDEGNYTAASAAWREAKSLDPKSALAKEYFEMLEREKDAKLKSFTQIAEKALAKGDYATAREYYEKASSLSPEDKAIADAYSKVVAKAVEMVARRKESALAHVAAREYRKAAETFQEVLALEPNDDVAKSYVNEIRAVEKMPALYADVKRAVDGRRFMDAKKLINEMTNTSFRYLTDAAGVLTEVRAVAEAVDTEVKKQEKEDALIVQFEAGAAHFKRKRFREAIALWKEMLAQDPSNELAREYIQVAEERIKEEEDKNYNNAVALIQKGDWAAARDELAKALSLNPDNNNAKNEMTRVKYEIDKAVRSLESDGEGSFKGGGYADAHKAFEKAAVLDPENYRVKERMMQIKVAEEYAKKAEAFEAEGKFADAMAALAEIIAMNPDDAAAQGKIIAHRERVQKDLEKNLAEGSDFYAKGDLYKAIKRWEAILPVLTGSRKNDIAAKIAEAKRKIEEVKTDMLETARKYSASRNYSAAITAYRKAIENDPQNTQLRRELEDVERRMSTAVVAAKAASEEDVRRKFAEGVEFYKAGDYRQAIAAWQRVLQMDPSNEKAKSYIGRARTKLELSGN